MDTLYEDQFTCLDAASSAVLTLINIIKYRQENQNSFCVQRNRVFYKIMCKNTVKPIKPNITTVNMRIACWIPLSTNTKSEYVILVAYPLQHWLHEHTPKLRYTYIAGTAVRFVNTVKFYRDLKLKVLRSIYAGWL
jgi:hypothetical protein